MIDEEILALAGGRAARLRPDLDRVMRLGSAQIGGQEIDAITKVLLGQVLFRYHGHTVAEFESAFVRFLERPDYGAVAVNSGSSALQLALAATGIGPGDEVIMPSMGFVSAACAVLSVGATPRIVPVDRSLNIDLRAAAEAVCPNTKAILAVHMFGSACDLSGVRGLAETCGAAVIEDSAQACGARYRGRPVGTFGDLSAFSFQHFKLVSTGEGGMVVGPRGTLLDRAAFMHDASAIWTMPDVASRVFDVRLPPLNLRMGEIEGALGLTQLARWDEFTLRLRAVKDMLADYLRTHPAVSMRPHADPTGELATQLIIYLPNRHHAAWICQALKAEGVNANPLLGPRGTNRHWAGDWGPVLARCGEAPYPEVLALQDMDTMAAGISLSIDMRHDVEDSRQTLRAMEKVLPPGDAT